MHFTGDRTHTWLMTCFMVSMSGIAFALINEYRFFKSQVQELEVLKKQYHTCIQSLKRDNTDFVLPTLSLSHDKPRQLLLVNRKKKYLQKEALKFARLHKLEKPVSKLYEKQNAEPKNQEKKNASAVRRLSRKSSFKTRSYQIRRKRIRRITRIKRARRTVQSEKFKLLKEKLALACPLPRGKFRISSPYGPRKNPNGSYGFHTGIDLAASKGTPIRASASGKIMHASNYGGYGNMVLISHPGHAKTRYGHLSKIDVKPGQQVKKGDLIGEVGNTGHVRRRKGGDGSHLHFELYIGGRRINPYHFISWR